jgi:hypothetical protein
VSTPLYQKCPLCKGTRKTQSAAMVDGLPTGKGTTYSGPVKAGAACFACTDGYVEVGLTLGQVERALELKRARAAAALTETDYCPLG